jgi:hypothetical protein
VFVGYAVPGEPTAFVSGFAIEERRVDQPLPGTLWFGPVDPPAFP